jgi:ABC-type amino acid transport substrate-binding protein
MKKTITPLLLLLMMIAILGGWPAGSRQAAAEGPSSKPELTPLRVGVTANYPPMIFKMKGKIVGLEADFAFLLGKALNREVLLVELPWNDQINALMEGKTDIIMSAMTITEARKVRVDFSDPYLKSGLVAMMRTEDAARYSSRKKVLESIATVGLVKGTTGEVFVRNRFLSATTVVPLKDSGEAPDLLDKRRIDLFVYDAPAVVWLVSENEATLRGLWEPLSEEFLAWAVSRDNQALLSQVNAALAAWKKDGTVKNVVSRWLPYWKDMDGVK